MSKSLVKLTATILVLLFLPLAGAFASGKMEVKIGEAVTLQGDNVRAGSTFKWIVKKGKEIVSTQSTSIFSYTFAQQGEYEVNLTVTDSLGNISNTSVSVLAGGKYPSSASSDSTSGDGGTINTQVEGSPIVISYSTLPSPGSDGAIHLIGDSKVLFNILPTNIDVIEYRIDRNIFQDSDGNGKANDDIDNSGDDSYLLGGSWESLYKEGESAKTVAEITLVNKAGEKAKSQVEIVFDQGPKKEGDPVAIMQVTPEPNPKDQLVYLYEDPSVVGFYSKMSEGKILEYRIDKNIFEDSNGDGNPANDIDNLNDVSFKTGDTWSTQYSKTDEQIIAQLIVVGEGGKGSRVQRGIWFSDSPRPPTIVEVKKDIQLISDKSFVLKGDPITFTVTGLKQTLDNYTFAWDFDGNGEVDKEIEGDNTVSNIYDYADLYTVKVTVTDKDGVSADFSLETLVKDVIATVANFEYIVNGNSVQFTNLSTVALNLTNKNLDYTWSFGDTDAENYNSQKDQTGVQDPTYTYSKAGKYIVTLSVVDADQVTDTKTAEITIDESAFQDEQVVGDITQDETVAPDTGGGGSIIVKILKIILYLILIVIVLIVLIVVGFLSFLKIQQPDLTFDELIDELKIKILTKLGVHDMIETAPTEESVVEPIEELTSEPATEEKPTEESATEEEPIEGEVMEKPPLAEQTGPVPDWMKGGAMSDSSVPKPEEKKEEEKTSEDMAKDLMGEPEEYDEEENEDEDEPPKPPKNGQAPSLSDQSGPVPDWLKGA
ncbi:PKD domain-containing protein [Candidatus Peregrinibacteria bacterium]|nr:PKD domain-containing protein [Candidatus Peregrinibacteria bacterium]